METQTERERRLWAWWSRGLGGLVQHLETLADAGLAVPRDTPGEVADFARRLLEVAERLRGRGG